MKWLASQLDLGSGCMSSLYYGDQFLVSLNVTKIKQGARDAKNIFSNKTTRRIDSWWQQKPLVSVRYPILAVDIIFYVCLLHLQLYQYQFQVNTTHRCQISIAKEHGKRTIIHIYDLEKENNFEVFQLRTVSWNLMPKFKRSSNRDSTTIRNCIPFSVSSC